MREALASSLKAAIRLRQSPEALNTSIGRPRGTSSHLNQSIYKFTRAVREAADALLPNASQPDRVICAIFVGHTLLGKSGSKYSNRYP